MSAVSSVLPHGPQRDRPVHGAGIDVSEAQPLGQAARHAALTRAGRTVDGDDYTPGVRCHSFPGFMMFMDSRIAGEMRPDEFDRLVEWAYGRVPARFRKRLKNVAMVVEAEPSPQQLAEAGVGHGGTLLGLYQGRPLTARSVFENFAMPDRITIFQGPHERLAHGEAHLKQLVEDTVWHEVAHYFGMDEPGVREAERRRRSRR